MPYGEIIIGAIAGAVGGAVAAWPGQWWQHRATRKASAQDRQIRYEDDVRARSLEAVQDALLAVRSARDALDQGVSAADFDVQVWRPLLNALMSLRMFHPDHDDTMYEFVGMLALAHAVPEIPGIPYAATRATELNRVTMLIEECCVALITARPLPDIQPALGRSLDIAQYVTQVGPTPQRGTP